MTLTLIETTPPRIPSRRPEPDMTTEPRIEIVDVTRRQAQQLLATNIKHNRTVSQPTVDKYARDMDADAWHLTGETVKVDSDGHLIDGQHRLRALLQSRRRSVRMAVAYDVDPESVVAVDTGRPRRFADQLRIEEATRNALVAQVVRRVVMWESGIRAVWGGKSPMPTHTELLTRYRKDPDLFIAAAARGNDAAKAGLGPAWVPGLMYVLTLAIDPEQSHRFFDQLISGANLPAASPILALRKRLTTPMQRAEAYKPVEKLHVYVRAWNDWRADIPIVSHYQRPKAAVTNATFPVPK